MFQRAPLNAVLYLNLNDGDSRRLLTELLNPIQRARPGTGCRATHAITARVYGRDTAQLNKLPDHNSENVTVLSILRTRVVSARSRSLYAVARPSVVCLSVGNARAPYSGGCDYPQYFYGIRYPGHPWTSTENFTEIVPGEPLRRGS